MCRMSFSNYNNWIFVEKLRFYCKKMESSVQCKAKEKYPVANNEVIFVSCMV